MSLYPADSKQPEQKERLSEERIKGRGGGAAQSPHGAPPSLAEISEEDEDEEEGADGREGEREGGVQEFPDRVTVKMQALKGNEGESQGADDAYGHGRQSSEREEGGEEEEEEQDGGGEAEEAGVQEFPDSITAKMQALRGRLSRVSHSGKNVFDDPSASETSAAEAGHQERPGRSYSSGPGGYKEGGAGGGDGWAVDEDEEHDKGFGGPGKEGANDGGVGRGEDRRGVYDDIDESFTAGGWVCVGQGFAA